MIYLKLKKAIDSAKLTELISKLPRGLNTIIGENGISLSGGQRQRLAIARAFYRESRLLIMDEATSSLDNKTESSLVETLSRIDKQRTILIIAHRLSTLKYCDRVLELKDGKIIEKDDY